MNAILSAPSIRLAANFLLFQLAWFAAVMGGAADRLWIACAPALGVCLLHLWLNRTKWRSEIVTILAVTALGIALETVFIHAPALLYHGMAADDFFPPVWIVALWLAFGTLPHGSLRWLSGRLFLQIGLGAVFGPLSYLAGGRLGAAELVEPVSTSLIIIALGWGVIMPAIFVVCRAIDRLARPKRRVVKLEDFTAEEIELISKSEVPPGYDHLDAELKD